MNDWTTNEWDYEFMTDWMNVWIKEWINKQKMNFVMNDEQVIYYKTIMYELINYWPNGSVNQRICEWMND